MESGRHAKTQQGLTLVELMVALLIGLLITLGATQLFITSKRSFNRVESLAKRQEAMRFLVDSLSLDIRTADKGGITTNGDGVLRLTYSGTRTEDPYCRFTEALQWVEYTHDDPSSSVRIRYQCTDTGDMSPAPLVDGIAGIGFSVAVDGTYVDVDTLFLPLGEETEDERSIRFRVTNRNSVIE